VFKALKVKAAGAGREFKVLCHLTGSKRPLFVKEAEEAA
jgi:hypothetical protein